jgi:hypothetical protein
MNLTFKTQQTEGSVSALQAVINVSYYRFFVATNAFSSNVCFVAQQKISFILSQVI